MFFSLNDQLPFLYIPISWPKKRKNYIPTAIQKPLQIKEEGDIEILSDGIEVSAKKVFFEILVLREIIQGRRK